MPHAKIFCHLLVHRKSLTGHHAIPPNNKAISATNIANAIVIIKVPVGKKIRFDRSVNTKLNPATFETRRSYRNGRLVEIHTTHNGYWRSLKPDTDYVMGEDDILRDSTGKPASHREDFRYNRNDESIEEREKKNSA